MVVFAHSRHPGAARPEAAGKLDASLLALALHEAEAERFLDAIDEAEMRLISAALCSGGRHRERERQTHKS
jgi:hypothetical protein